jgi:CHAT domain-containing protein
MKAFYERLNRGVPKSEALREARLSLLQNSSTTWHPVFLGCFRFGRRMHVKPKIIASV